MSDFVYSEPRPGVLCLAGELTIANARELHGLLLGVLTRNAQLELDLLNVSKFDCAGVQLLLMLHKEARAQGKPLTWLGFSLSVAEILELLGLAELLGRPGAVMWG
jgi:anti-sigma B factor antagonist